VPNAQPFSPVPKVSPPQQPSILPVLKRAHKPDSVLDESALDNAISDAAKVLVRKFVAK